MMYSKSCQLSPLEVHAAAPFSFGLPLPSRSELLGKRKPPVPLSLVHSSDMAGKKREKKGTSTFKRYMVPMWKTKALNCNEGSHLSTVHILFCNELTKEKEKNDREVTPLSGEKFQKPFM